MRTDRLKLLVKLVDDQLAREIPPARVIAMLVESHDAKTSFNCGANVLRCGGVAGSCTSDRGKLLLDSWLGSARRSIEKAELLLERVNRHG